MTDIAECISFLTSAAAKSMGRLARDRLAPLGITPVQYALMRSLYESPGATGAEISARLFMDSATMTGLVDRLEKLELVNRRADGGDRRVNRLHLTQRGMEMMPRLDAAIDAVNAEADRRLGPEAARFRAGLKTLIENA